MLIFVGISDFSRRASVALALFGLTLLATLLATGCGQPPSMRDAGEPDAATTEDGGGGMDAFPPGTVFCDTDADCDDDIGCTRDSCGTRGTCLNIGDTAACDDGNFCNGVEQCDARTGCRPGDRQTCNDDEVCTIDRCDEETKMCTHADRDLDEDGDPDWFCAGGGDCDETDPTVSSMLNEVCDDFIDNDCDEMIDETDCGRPPYDICDDPLDVSAGGFFDLSTEGAAPDYSLVCPGFATSGRSDVVAAFTLTEARSVTITGEGDFSFVGLSLRTNCTDGSSQLACDDGFPGSVRRRSLPAGTYYVIVGSTSAHVGLTVAFGAPLPLPTNDVCGSPIDVSAGGRFTGSFVEVADDLTASCAFSGSPDLVYSFTTTAEQDVQISAESVTGESLAYSVRTTCESTPSEVRCDYGSPAAGTFHQLPAGTYFLVVEGPSFADPDFTLDVAFLAPTPPPLGDSCASPIALTPGSMVTGTLTDKQNDHDVSCGFRYRDAVYSFTLSEASDVTVQLDAGGFANMSLRPTCTDSATQIRCTSGSPARQRIRNLAAGTYYLIVEASSPSGFTLQVDVTTPPTIPVEVTGNESCADPHVMPATGGLFHGDTSTMASDLSGARCGGGAGSRDAVYELTLAARSRVIASTEGSAYDTVLVIHRTACTAGGELYCDDDGGEGATSLIDQMLDPGTYYIVVDGFGTASAGDYLLEVRVTP
jgi:hypothetical protein